MSHSATLSSVRDFLKGLPELLNTPITLSERRVTRHKRSKRPAAAAMVENPGIPFIVEGELTKGMATLYSVAGQDFVVTPETFVLGELRVGAIARIKGTLKGDVRYAQSIVLSLRP